MFEILVGFDEDFNPITRPMTLAEHDAFIAAVVATA